MASCLCRSYYLALKADRKHLEYQRELELSKEPIKADLMIIKKEPGIRVKNQIGHIFKRYNILEYKSPDDNLTIDDYYKVIAYASLYKALGKGVNSVPSEELTISLVRDNMPDKLFKHLEGLGLKIEKTYSGIYYVEGSLILPRQQIIVTQELDGKDNAFLKVLTKNLEIATATEFVTEAQRLRSKEDRINLNAVLNVSFSANEQLYDTLRKEYKTMTEIFKKLFKEDYERMLSELNKEKAAKVKAIAEKKKEKAAKEKEKAAKEKEKAAKEKEKAAKVKAIAEKKKAEAKIRELQKQIEELRASKVA